MNRTINFQAFSNKNLELIYTKNSKLSFSNHNHISIYTIGILIDGEFILALNNTTTSIKENVFYIISPYEPHSIKCTQTYSLINICINKNYIYKDGSINTITKLFLKFLNNYNLPIKYLSHLHKGINIILNSNASICNNNYLENIKNTIELYPENNISIGNIANCAFLSNYYFIRKFKSLYGLTPYKFQLQNRINKSKYLLISDYNITEVAFLMGFYDQSHFIKQFKKIVGLTPSEYKSSFTTYDD